MTSLAGAVAQMAAAGMPPLPPDHPKFGKTYRYGPKKKAFYRLYEHPLRNGGVLIAGWFGWYGKIDYQKLEVEWGDIDPAQRARMKRESEEAEQRERAKKRERAHLAANRAKLQWKAASDAGPFPYLDRKGVTPEGVRAFTDGTVLIPLRNIVTDEVVGVQKIAADGGKLYNRHMAKAGAACVLGDLFVQPEPPVAIVVEGYATGRSIRMALAEAGRDVPVVVALDAYGLIDVTYGLRKRLSSTFLLFAADDDFKTEGNPGLAHAEKAAHIAGLETSGNAAVVAPVFADRGDQKLTDFNDLHAVEGLAVVREQLVAAIDAGLAAKRERQVASAPPPGPPSPPVGAGAGQDEPPPGPPPDSSDDWRTLLARTATLAIKPTLGNLALILRNDDRWDGVIAKNEFSEAVVKRRAPPYSVGGIAALGEWTDVDDIRLRMWVERVYGFSPRAEDVVSAVVESADRHRYHPVREYLSGLAWDGQRRVAHWLVDYMGADDTEYTREVGRRWLMSAMARVMEPGCKADAVLILEGPQNIGKSTGLAALASPWFTDAKFNLGDKEAYLLIQGAWIVELAELDSLGKADATAAKMFFSQQVNHYRPWYAKRPVHVPRQCVFAGTTNSDSYLRDETGNRRYWPVTVREVDLVGIKTMRDQLWAEVLADWREYNDPSTAAERRHALRWWADYGDAALFGEQQERRQVQDAYTELISDWLQGQDVLIQQARTDFEGFTLSEILEAAIKLDRGRWTPAEQQRVGRCMRLLGFTKQRSSNKARGRPWVYRRSILADAEAGHGATGSDDVKEPMGDEDAVPI